MRGLHNVKFRKGYELKKSIFHGGTENCTVMEKTYRARRGFEPILVCILRIFFGNDMQQV